MQLSFSRRLLPTVGNARSHVIRTPEWMMFAVLLENCQYANIYVHQYHMAVLNIC